MKVTVKVVDLAGEDYLATVEDVGAEQLPRVLRELGIGAAAFFERPLPTSASDEELERNIARVDALLLNAPATPYSDAAGEAWERLKAVLRG